MGEKSKERIEMLNPISAGLTVQRYSGHQGLVRALQDIVNKITICISEEIHEIKKELNMEKDSDKPEECKSLLLLEKAHMMVLMEIEEFVEKQIEEIEEIPNKTKAPVLTLHDFNKIEKAVEPDKKTKELLKTQKEFIRERAKEKQKELKESFFKGADIDEENYEKLKKFWGFKDGEEEKPSDEESDE